MQQVKIGKYKKMLFDYRLEKNYRMYSSYKILLSTKLFNLSPSPQIYQILSKINVYYICQAFLKQELSEDT